LVNSLASFARINEFGFLETPYRKVVREAKNDGNQRLEKLLQRLSKIAPEKLLFLPERKSATKSPSH
jgi:DNA-directed RNA polymerase subunit beta